MKMAQESVQLRCSYAHQCSGKPTPGSFQALPIAPGLRGTLFPSQQRQCPSLSPVQFTMGLAMVVSLFNAWVLACPGYLVQPPRPRFP